MTHASALTRAAALALCAALAACGGDGSTPPPPPPPPTVASVNVTAPAPTLVAGTTAQLTGTPLTASGQAVAGKTLQWQSSSAGVATVSATGFVTAVAPGTARITASVDGISGFVDLTVRAAIASVHITPNPAEVAPGASRNLFLAALDAGNAPVLGFAQPVWTSSNEAVATVSGGLVTGVAPGTAEIRATVEGVQGTATVRVAVPMPSGLRLSSISAGSLHACGLDTDGRAWCWGINQSGQLGATSSDQCTRSGAPAVACSTYPIPVNTGLRFTAIDAGTDGGGQGTCAIATSGRPYCWGGGSSGQLGNGQKNSQPQPVAVDVPAGLSFTQVAAGGRFACALATDGTAWCWGDNFFGTLGSGSPFADAVATPVQVNTPERFTSLSAAGVTACGLTAAGNAFCWGRLDFSREARAPVLALSGVTQIVAGGSSSSDVHVCGLQTDGTARCWGSNAGGQLGITLTNTTNAFANPVVAMGGLTFTGLYAGAGYTCGMQAGGTVLCAGRNSYGELGVGSLGMRDQPTAVSGPPFRTLSTGWFSCGIGTDGIAYCWGRNEYGELASTEGTTCQPSPGAPAIPCALQPVRVRGQD